jgi:lysophospholipase L1-like esterase
MKNFKVTIIGNSVALRTRPHSPVSKNYGQLLEEKLADHFRDTYCLVHNRAFSRATLLDILAESQSLISEFPNFYIINAGVCDAATREVPLWFSNIINDPKGGFLKKLFSFVHHYFIKPNNAFFTRLRGKRSWVSPADFSKLYSKLINDLQHNTNAGIICLGINLANQRVEDIIPGTSKKYRDYSDLIKNCAQKAGIPYIDTHDLRDHDHYPDGTHFNDAGHQIMAERILEVILHENR